MIENVFKKLNLKEIHAKIYLSLLESGPLPAGKLVKKLNMPRSTVYGFLDDLSKRGLVMQSEKLAVKVWQAARPEKINNILSEEVNSFEKTKDKFNALLPQLLSQQKIDFISPKFNYFEGPDGIKHILKDILLYRDIKTETFWPIEYMLEVIGDDYLAEHNKKRIKQNIYIKGLWPGKDIENIIKKNNFLGSGDQFRREIRKAPEQIESMMGYWAYENKVAFVSSRREAFGFIVESMELRKLLKTQFEILWQMSKPVKVEEKYTKKFLETL